MPSSCWRPVCVAGLVLVVGLGLLGCNVFDAVQPAPSSVEDLLADARIAMTKGNHQRAVDLLETAFERDSTHVGVRVELANALYAAHGLDVFAVRAAVEHLNGKGAASASGEAAGPVCTDDADLSRSPGRFLSVSVEHRALERLAARWEQIQRASRLVIAGGLERRASAFAREPPDVRAKGYLIAALTRVSRRVLGLRTTVQDTGTRLYVDTSGVSGRAVVACGNTREAVVRTEQSLCRQGRGARRAVSWLQVRNGLVGSDQTSLLIDLLGTHAAAVGTRLACPASTRS